MAYTYADLGACGCTDCTLTIPVQGCNGLPLAGATVTLYVSQGGAELGSQATDAQGLASFTGLGAGPYYYTVTATGWQDASGTAPCPWPSNDVVALNPQAGYRCWAYGDCVQAAPLTMNATLSAQSSGCADATYTLTWDATNSWWIGTQSANACAPTQAIIYDSGGALAGNMSAQSAVVQCSPFQYSAALAATGGTPSSTLTATA